MFIKILIVIAVVIAGILIYATTKPDSFSVKRSVKIQASSEQIFSHINNFNRWKPWSPWEKMDPDMKRTYSGPSEGVGSGYTWVGNNKVGQGGMQILESDAAKKIVIQLDFIKPFEAHNIAQFDLIPETDGVTLVWEMRGQNIFMGKVMSIFCDMDKMVGKDFETGLSNLKQIVEAEGK